MSPIAGVLAKLESVKKSIRSIGGKQIFSASVRTEMHALAEAYFASVRVRFSPSNQGPEVERADHVFRDLHALSRKRASKRKCLTLLTEGKSLLVRLEGFALAQAANRSTGSRTASDDLIISTLRDICPSGALAYLQALDDMEAHERHSWRGPATDLRESLRETLDVLAPDPDVEATAGYKLEPDAKRPTMKQKVRFILRNRGVASGQMTTPDSAVQGVEDMLGGLTRSVYTRSSVSTHTPTTRAEVLRIHAWVRLVLCELLELPV